MARYKVEDGIILDTANAAQTWNEASDWNGRNHISRATGSQWEHETLYKSAKGKYWIECTSQWQGSLPSARPITKAEAAAWILHNDGEIPSDLEDYAAQVAE